MSHTRSTARPSPASAHPSRWSPRRTCRRGPEETTCRHTRCTRAADRPWGSRDLLRAAGGRTANGGRACLLNRAESCDHSESPCALRLYRRLWTFARCYQAGLMGMERAVILCDGYFGQSTGKTANGLVRYSKRYQIAGVIDHTKLGRDAGDILDGKPNGIPVVASLREALDRCEPKTLIIGVATFGGYIPPEFRPIIREAIENNLNVVAGLHEFLNDDAEFVKLAQEHGVRLVDVRRPRPIRESKQFSDVTRTLPCLRIPVLGTDGAIGKRTTALLLTDALNAAGIPSAFVATGQTGLLQGSSYGVPLDSIKADFMVGGHERGGDACGIQRV